MNFSIPLLLYSGERAVHFKEDGALGIMLGTGGGCSDEQLCREVTRGGKQVDEAASHASFHQNCIGITSKQDHRSTSEIPGAVIEEATVCAAHSTSPRRRGDFLLTESWNPPIIRSGDISPFTATSTGNAIVAILCDEPTASPGPPRMSRLPGRCRIQKAWLNFELASQRSDVRCVEIRTALRLFWRPFFVRLHTGAAEQIANRSVVR